MNFRFIYILEAHAQDEWPICSARWSPTKQPIKYNQTHTIEERLIVAKDFLRDFDFPIPMVIDKPDENLFEKFYAPWPVRIYVIDNEHRLTYKAQPSETMLELKELTEHLESMIKRNKY
jgi:type I thyroxine 5'-deiodinase